MVIEVRLVNPSTAEVLTDQFTLTSPSNKWNATDHTAMHREAIELAMKASCGLGAEALKTMQRVNGPEFAGSGAVTAYRYMYSCTLALPDDDVEREMLAVCFAQKEQKS